MSEHSSGDNDNNFDAIFDRTLNKVHEGPVSEALLYRLLSIAELAIEHELKRIGSTRKCLGLRLGYNLLNQADFIETSGQNHVKSYCVNWGCCINSQDFHNNLEATDENISSSNNNEAMSNETFLSLEFINKLTKRIQEEVERQTSLETLSSGDLDVWLFGYTDQLDGKLLERNLAFASSSTICCQNGGGKKLKPGTTECDGDPCQRSDREPD